MKYKKSQTATSILSFIFSFLASSHHWLHMGILLLLGGSTNMMATMSAALWIRRIMIIATIITMLVSMYRLFKHKSKVPWVIIMTFLSATISLGFIMYTLVKFGW
ncbi:MULTISPECIES: hypothetical protein [unclassified Paenibacillus]|uniref:hypothetical protein n=1 Tax=unclassified Paenibacillus TaxID=185978 RepID=UPI0027828C67|nr:MULTISPECIES: hypothetical protein [unclassified Paenibacillus]MDQ0900741.1 hypothetical protein [Paenibacillus sp. V4I7]MDQ0920749.1 hypothetical protein [Paenibacillus sp. V4I5]